MKRLFVVLLTLCIAATVFSGGGGQASSGSSGGIIRDLGPGKKLTRADGTVFPSRQIEIVVPNAAGGGQDLMSRQIGTALSKVLGVPVSVNNIAGASGMRAAGYVYNAAPDGHMFMSSNMPSRALSALIQDPGFPVRALTPLIVFGVDPYLVAVHKNVPYNTFQEIIDAYKTGKLTTVAASGFGVGDDYMGKILRDKNGMNFKETIYYNGSGDMIAALLREEVPLAFLPSVSAINMVAEGELKPIMVLSRERASTFPNVPSYTADLGYEDISALSEPTRIFLAPPNTPEDIRQFLNESIAEAIRDPELVAWAKENSIELLATDITEAERVWNVSFDYAPTLIPPDVMELMMKGTN